MINDEQFQLQLLKDEIEELKRANTKLFDDVEELNGANAKLQSDEYDEENEDLKKSVKSTLETIDKMKDLLVAKNIELKKKKCWSETKNW